MATRTIQPASSLRGTLQVPGDKSISHRAALFAALARGTTTIRRFLMAGDCLHTLGALRALGVPVTVQRTRSTVIVHGVGWRGLRAPARAIDCGNSGTTMRLFMGLLAGRPWSTTLRGDRSLSRRPMARVATPLERMGARITPAGGRTRATGELHAPLTVHGRDPLRAIRYRMPVASAQVKSAILLAGLSAKGVTRVVEPVPTRDHTERMLRQFGVDVRTRGRTVSLVSPFLSPVPCLLSLAAPRSLTVPGDISSAAFFLVAAAIVPGSRVTVRGVGLNPTRTGALDVLRRMGARLRVMRRAGSRGAEPVGDVTVAHGPLRAVNVSPAEVPRLIDELPILMVAASCARGVSVFRGVAELRVKESDRIRTMAEGLRRLGARVDVRGGDTVALHGGRRLHGATVESYGDHRIAMSLAIAGLVAATPVTIRGADCVAISFPAFWSLLARLRR